MRRLALAAAIAAAVLAPQAAPAARSGPVELGTAVGGPALMGDTDPRFRGTLAVYDAVTAENDMKMYYQRPAADRFDFAVGDALVAFAAARGQRVHGHTLVWCNDSSNPGWMRNRAWTRAQLLAVMDEHITTVLTHYRGKVASWDVVNEAVADTGGGRRDCLWQRVIGADWVEQAFRIARRADPAVKLFYNEVRVDTANAKYEAMLALLRDLRARDVPLDGVGLQYHLTRYQPKQPEIEEAIRRVGELGLAVHISELDVPVWYLGSGMETKLRRQADTYRAIAAACQAQPACFRITTWGFTDRYTWRGPGSWPLPWDEEYRPKPAWAAIRAVLRPAPPPPGAPPAPAAATPGAASATPAAASPPALATTAAPAARTLTARQRRALLRKLLRRRALAVVKRRGQSS